MKALNKIACLFSVMLPSLSMQAQVQITPGLKVTASGPVILTFYNAGFINHGDFVPGNSTARFGGQYSTSHIGGSKPIDFYNLVVDKASHDLSLQNSIRISGELTMEKGNLQLNEHAVDLGYTGYINKERNESRITGGKNGIVKALAILDAPRAANPGNIGAEISSPSALGETMILRGYVVANAPDGVPVIQRYYDIRPQRNNNLHATLKFHYLDIELAGWKGNESSLALFTASKGSNQWVFAGKDAIDISTNWITRNELSQLHRFTIAADLSKKHDQISMQLFPNPTSGRFTVMLNMPREKQVVLNLYDHLGRLLECRSFQSRAGVNIMSWDIGKYAAGSYFLSVQNTGNAMLKLIKQ